MNVATTAQVMDEPGFDSPTQPQHKPSIWNKAMNGWDKAMVWAVGGRIAPHYTRADVHSIKHGVPALGISVAMATTGATILLGRYNMVPPGAVLPVAAGIGTAYFFLDRTIMSAEAKRKARDAVERITLDPGVKRSRFNRVLGFAPLAIRATMILASTSLTAGPIVMKAAHSEIVQQLGKEYQQDNQVLLAEVGAQKQSYDAQITNLSQHAAADRQAIEKQKQDQLDMATQDPNAAQSAVDQRLAALQNQILEQKSVIAKDQALMASEADGGTFAGATGVSGKGKQYATDAAKLQFDQQQLANLIAQEAILQQQLRDAAKRDQAAAANAQDRQAVLQQTGGALQDDLARTQAQLDALQQGRATAFQTFEDTAKNDPRYKEHRSGFFAETAALNKFMADPEIGPIAKTQLAFLSIVLFAFELSAMISAGFRKATPGEIRDAEIELAAQNEIKKQVLSRHANWLGFRADMDEFTAQTGNPGAIRSFEEWKQRRPRNFGAGAASQLAPSPGG